MERIPLIESESQEYFVVLDFGTGKIYSNRISKEFPVETRGPKRSFYPPEVFSSWEYVNNPKKTVDDLMLDCWWNEHGDIIMPITDALLDMFPEARPETIWFVIILKEKTHEGAISFGDILFIGVRYWEKERTEKEAKDEELSIENNKERNRYAFPKGYSTHGGTGNETKTAKVEKKEKPELSGEPDKVDRPSSKKRRHKTPGDLLKYIKTMGVKKSSVVIFKALHKASWYGHSTKLWVWHSKRHKMGRWFTGGIAKVMNMTGLSKKTVKRGFKELRANDVIYKRAHGRIGVSNTIWELAFKIRHVNAEKRKPKGSKK